MLKSDEIGKLIEFMESQNNYPFIMEVDEFTITIEEYKPNLWLTVGDKSGEVLFSAKNKKSINGTLEIREYYKNQDECDLVEIVLRGVLA